MRIFTFIVVLYAFLSLIFSRSETLTSIETTALNFYRPWDAFRGNSEFLPEPPPPPAISAWWNPIVNTPGLGEKHAVLAARAYGRIRENQSKVAYYTHDALPVEAGDPVVMGSALVGFVAEHRPPAGVLVTLLHDRNSPLLAGEVKGTVAGEEIGFAAGGPSPEMRGAILLRIPSVRLGLVSGSTAYSRAHPLTPKVPHGLLLGRVTLHASSEAEQLDEAALVPAYSPHQLHRVGILVPVERLAAGTSAVTIPEVSLQDLEVSACLASGRNQFRVYAGKERGLARGDLLVRGGYALARLEHVGLFASSASLLAAPGEEIEVACTTSEDLLRRFRITIIRRTGLVLEVEAEEKPEDLMPGLPLYLTGDPCSGMESSPAFLVLHPGEGKRFSLTVPWSAAGESRCLHFESAP